MLSGQADQFIQRPVTVRKRVPRSDFRVPRFYPKSNLTSPDIGDGARKRGCPAAVCATLTGDLFMGAYPTSPREAFLAWCQDHSEVFTQQASQIGLSASEATLFVN